MDEYLEKRIYIYRKSYSLYQKISISLSVSTFTLSGSGLSDFIFIPLAALSLSASIVEVIEKSLNIFEKKEEYKQYYVFYKQQLFNLLKSKSITEQEIYQREQDFINNLKYFIVEKYVKQTQLNGCKYVIPQYMVCKKNFHIFKSGTGHIGLVEGDFLSWIQGKINPPEMHLPGCQYCGSFTKLEKRLIRVDPGINRVDKACKNKIFLIANQKMLIKDI